MILDWWLADSRFRGECRSGYRGKCGQSDRPLPVDLNYKMVLRLVPMKFLERINVVKTLNGSKNVDKLSINVFLVK